MSRSAVSRIAITIGLLAFAAAFWFLQAYGTAKPVLAPVNASPSEFSATRAEQVLARILGPEKPHPVSTAENARVRARIVGELAALGLRPLVHRGFACHSPRSSGVLICANVNDIIADVRPGAGSGIVLLAHYDSVPAGPGAADDESGVATVIETARALIARGIQGRHPIMAVLSDGEEADLLGAASFLNDPKLKARVGAVINVEARGNQGPSLLFQTSPGDGALIDLYATYTSYYATSSLYHEIYRFLPNDTDLTLFIGDGFPSYNFAYVGGLPDYHTANDTRAHLDPVSLQEQGDNMLGVAGGLERAEFSQLRGQDAIYFDILGRWLPRVPQSWALPLAIAAIFILLVAALIARETAAPASEWLRGFAITPVLLFVAVASGFALHAIASLISGMPEPAYAHPAALRIALALELGGATMVVSRLASSRATATGVWAWFAILGLVAAILAPGFSPYFLFPALAAAILLLAASFAPGRWDGAVGASAMLLASLGAFLIWSALGTSGEALMGLRLHPLFTVPFALALSTLVPLLARVRLARLACGSIAAALFMAAIAAAVVQGLGPAYSRSAAQRLNITYLEGRTRAYWAVDTAAPLPARMRSIAQFSPQPERIVPEVSAAYVAQAGSPRFPLPTATIIARPPAGHVRRVTFLLHASDSTDQIYLVIPRSAGVRAIDTNGWHFDAPSDWSNEQSVALACMSRDCARQTVTLTLTSSSAVSLGLYEHRFGLPPFANPLVAARPHWAVQSQNGDGMTLVNVIHVPGTQ